MDTLISIAKNLEWFIDTTVVCPDGQVIMVKQLVDRIHDLKIVIYPNDHTPPHFHVLSTQRNIDAKIRIDTLELLGESGHSQITKNDLRKKKSHFTSGQKEYEKLKEVWDKFHPQG